MCSAQRGIESEHRSLRETTEHELTVLRTFGNESVDERYESGARLAQPLRLLSGEVDPVPRHHLGLARFEVDVPPGASSAEHGPQAKGGFREDVPNSSESGEHLYKRYQIVAGGTKAMAENHGGCTGRADGNRIERTESYAFCLDGHEWSMEASGQGRKGEVRQPRARALAGTRRTLSFRQGVPRCQMIGPL